MAPKRGKSASTQRPAPDWSWVALEDITSVDELTEEHLRKAIGLETSRPCRNKLGVAQTPVIIDLEQEDSDDEDRRSPSKDDSGGRSDTKGKGKRKSMMKGNDEEWGPRCTSVWCQDNLLCLNHLGAKAWNAKTAHHQFIQAAKLGSPPVERKDVGGPVGLRNLGATCYANAFLQIWYYTLPFRNGIYASAASGTHDENSPIFQLALTFAALQTSEMKYYDPKGLVNALRLDTGNQQDASEFSKLFMTHLQMEFGKQADPRVRTLISDQFEGDLEYVTKCQKCSYRSARTEKFLELEMSLEGKCTLEDRLDHLVAPEELSGANAYQCPQCEDLTTARRKINLTHLPPILHFSVLRFVYDAELGDRKKSKAIMEFPARVDMSEWLNVNDSRRSTGPMWYELRGIVEHRGASAHRGHFVCQVYDSEREQWYLCNDEVVEPMDSLAMNAKPVSKGKASKQMDPSGYQDVVHKSGNAYMLVYVQSSGPYKNGVNQGSTPYGVTTPMPTGPLAEKVTQINKEYDALWNDFEMRKRQLEESFVDVKERKLNVMRAWNAGTSTEGFFMHSPSLRSWVAKGLASNQAVNGEKAKSVEVVEGSKTMESGVQQVRNGSGALGTHANGTQPSILKGFGSTSNIEQPTATISQAESPQETAKVADSPNPSLTETGDFNPLVYEFTNKAITCLHGNLDPEETDNIRVISAEGLAMLKNLGCTVDIEHGIRDICSSCVMEEVRRTKIRLDQRETRKAFDKAAKEPVDEGEGYLLLSSWLKAWRKGSIDSLKDSGDAADPADGLKTIACPHGKVKTPRARKSGDWVMVPPAAFAYLVSLTDIAEVPHFDLSSAACAECLEQEAQQVKALSGEIQQAKLEKERLKEMTQKSFLAKSNEIFDGLPAYLLSQSFVRQWLDWIEDPIETPRPIFSNRSLFCNHNQLLVDLEWNPDRRAGLFTLVYDDLWSKIVSLYDVSPDDTVLAEREGGYTRKQQILQVSVPLCVDCWKQRRSTAVLKLNIEEVNDVNEIPSRSAANTENENNDIAVELNGKRKNGHLQPNIRSTKRQRATQSKNGRIIELDLARDSTVLDLKKRINQERDILPIFQHLHHKGVELEDNTRTLGDLGVLTDDHLYLLSDEIPEDEIDEAMDDEGEDELVAKACARSLAGFNGTALFGLSANTAPTDASAQTENTLDMLLDEPMPEVAEEDPVQSCTTCTFLNPLTAEICKMCDMPFD